MYVIGEENRWFLQSKKSIDSKSININLFDKKNNLLLLLKRVTENSKFFVYIAKQFNNLRRTICM